MGSKNFTMDGGRQVVEPVAGWMIRFNIRRTMIILTDENGSTVNWPNDDSSPEIPDCIVTDHDRVTFAMFLAKTVFGLNGITYESENSYRLI